jgi:hypothetical protein
MLKRKELNVVHAPDQRTRRKDEKPIKEKNREKEKKRSARRGGKTI